MRCLISYNCQPHSSAWSLDFNQSSIIGTEVHFNTFSALDILIASNLNLRNQFFFSIHSFIKLKPLILKKKIFLINVCCREIFQCSLLKKHYLGQVHKHWRWEEMFSKHDQLFRSINIRFACCFLSICFKRVICLVSKTILLFFNSQNGWRSAKEAFFSPIRLRNWVYLATLGCFNLI